MQVYKKLGVLSLGLVVGVLIIKTTTPESLSQTTSQKQYIKSDAGRHYEEFPIVDLNAPEPSDPDELARRRARGKRYDHTGLDAENVKGFVFQDGTGTVSLGGPSSHWPVEPAFPVALSEVIAIGEVMDARAQISNDKTNVFCVFTVLIKDVYKNTTSASLTPERVITVDRYGGRVRLPSGKIITRGFLHQSMPLAGRRYVFFLKSNEEGQTYSIITGYELHHGRVIPLDGNRLVPGGGFPQLIEYDRYEGANETSFLKEIKDAIALSLQNSSREVGIATLRP